MRPENVGDEVGASRPILFIVIFTRRSKVSGIETTHCQSDGVISDVNILDTRVYGMGRS